MVRILRFEGLKEKGVCGSRMSLHRLRQDPNFPLPREIGGGIGWIESEVEEWLAARPQVKAKRAPRKVA